jgi:hypothetical protein
MRKPEVFRSERDIPVVVPDLAPVAQAAMKHFRDKGFEVVGGTLASGAWEISIHRGKWVKATLGTKLALNITIRPEATLTHVQAGAGVFGSSVVPAAISWYITWPTALTRAWGLIRQARLDDEAISVIESSLREHADPVSVTPESGRGKRATAATGASRPDYCTSCRHELTAEAAFCPVCGTRVA